MDWKDNGNEALVKAILSLETFGEAKHFLRDLMTEKEVTEFSKRLQAAELLIKKTPYSVIKQKTGLSSTTIARVSKWLNGKEGGYKTIINRLHHNSSLSK